MAHQDRRVQPLWQIPSESAIADATRAALLHTIPEFSPENYLRTLVSSDRTASVSENQVRYHHERDDTNERLFRQDNIRASPPQDLPVRFAVTPDTEPEPFPEYREEDFDGVQYSAPCDSSPITAYLSLLSSTPRGRTSTARKDVDTSWITTYPSTSIIGCVPNDKGHLVPVFTSGVEERLKLSPFIGYARISELDWLREEAKWNLWKEKQHLKHREREAKRLREDETPSMLPRNMSERIREYREEKQRKRQVEEYERERYGLEQAQVELDKAEIMLLQKMLGADGRKTVRQFLSKYGTVR